jgi:PAS domain S-box-containing protein
VTPQEEGPHVLIVEDDADTRSNLTDILELDHYRVETAARASDVLNRSNWSEISAVILDRKLPDGSAQELLPVIRQRAPHASVIVVTGYADLDGAISAIRQGAEDYILKPINADALRASLSRIAERRRATQEIHRLNTDLQRRVAELQTLLDVIPIGIAIARDVECQFISANPPLAKWLGVAKGANISMGGDPAERPKVTIVHDGRELTAEELPMQRAAYHNEEVRDVEFDIVQPDGRVINLIGNCSPLLDEQGQSRGAVGAFVDITEHKRLQARQLQKERLAAIGETMAGLVHESRNALQRSKACLEMLALEVEGQPEALKLVARTQQAQEHLHQLYEEVREYAAPINLKRELCDLTTIWRETWDHLAHLRVAKELTLYEEIQATDQSCDVDRFAVGQVFRNILENAISVSPPAGKVTLRCDETRLAGKPALMVAIRDEGPGLTKEQHQRIFEPFFTTKTKGTGLGMAIAQRIAQSHGGRISAGPPGQPGAEIIVVLPRGRL